MFPIFAGSSGEQGSLLLTRLGSIGLISSLQDHRPPKLVLVLPELVWLRRIRRVFDFFLYEYV